MILHFQTYLLNQEKAAKPRDIIKPMMTRHKPQLDSHSYDYSPKLY